MSAFRLEGKTALITGVREYVRENYAPPREPPAGLRVEMHPSVRRLLMVDPDLWEPPVRERDETGFFPVPVRVTADLKPGAWRLVIVTEEVLLEGQGTTVTAASP